MRGCNVNIYFSEETYNKIKPLIQQRKISSFVNQAVEKELESQQKEQKEQLRERMKPLWLKRIERIRLEV